MNTFIWIAAPLVVILFWAIGIYNRLVYRRNQTENAFASIDAYLKKRYDLIPNLVAAVKQYMVHEKSILTEITKLRAEALNPGITDDQKIEINNNLNRSLHSVHVAMENYPELKSDQNILQLQASLNEVEEQLSAARRTYNAAVMTFNNSVQSFPSGIIASMRGFKAKSFFETVDPERNNINVKELFNK